MKNYLIANGKLETTRIVDVCKEYAVIPTVRPLSSNSDVVVIDTGLFATMRILREIKTVPKFSMVFGMK